jgi:hypothetical protein
MPTFKPKTAKKIKVAANSNVTLDSKHKELVAKFSKEEDKLPKLFTEKKALKDKLTGILTVEERLSNQDRILANKTEIKKNKTMRTD